jgi:hypothetical protein
VAVDLPPPEIVLQTGLVGVYHHSAVEGWYFFELELEVFVPVEDVG